MTGIVLWSDNPKAREYAETLTLEYRYCGYNEIVDAQGNYDFSNLDKVLDEIAERNHQAVLRFYFCYVGKQTTVPDFIRSREGYEETVGRSENERTHFCDWSSQALKDFALDFYTRFATQYDKDPRIAFLQTGFGLWAEYHIYDGPNKLGKTFPSKSFQKIFFNHLNRQFTELPWSVSVDAADNQYSPLEGNPQLLALDFGLFDDSFLCKRHAKENAINWRVLGSKRWQRQPAGGELSYYNSNDQKNALSIPGPNGVSFQSSAKQFHITYMIGNDQTRYRTRGEIESAGMATGYRFRVTAASRHRRKLMLQVINDGIAPIYRHAYFSAGEKRSAKSLKGLLPGQRMTCEIAGITKDDLESISIHSDAILPAQRIEFDADLR